MLKIILLGGSNSVILNGLQRGLKETNVELYNFSLGGSSALQNLYEICRNRKFIYSCDLIITESNVNDIIMSMHFYNNTKTDYFLNICYRNINWLYEEIYKFRKKTISLILPWSNYKYYKYINNIHKKLSMKFGFNVIDMQEYYEKNNLEEFGQLKDGAHQFDFIMQELGKNIIANIHNFKKPKNNTNFPMNNPSFAICEATEMKFNHNQKKIYKRENSVFKESIMELSSNSIMCFSNKYENYYILASHTWNEKTNSRESQGYSEKIATVSKLCLNNQHQTVAIETCCLNWFVEFYPFKYQVTSETICYCDNSMEAFYQGLSQNKKEYLDKIDLVAFFLAYGDGEFYDNFKDYDILQNIEIYIDEKYDFNHIIPNVRNYKKGIDEYCRIMDERKLKLYRDQILKLKLEINNFNLKEMQYGLSKQRIYNHLAYKLGQAMIVNSKSILGYIRMPFVLSYIKDKHNQEQKVYQEKIKKDPSLKLPPLESYPDYKEALKEKECFTYKLGQALIKANKTWYGGGVYQIAI